MRVTQLKEFHAKDELLTLNENSTLSDAVAFMVDHNETAILVTGSNTKKLCGIVTQQDIVRRFLPMRKTLDDNVKLKDIMTRRLEVAHANDDVSACVSRMSVGGYGHMPVLDETENIVGMLYQSDFNALTWSQIMDRAKENVQDSIDHGRYEPILILLGVLLFVGTMLAFAVAM